MDAQLCQCTRPLSLLSVIYNEIDDYRGGWKKGEVKKVNVVVTLMRFQSCLPERERLAELASFVRQFPLPQKSHVQHTRDKQHVWFQQKTKAKKQK